MKKIITVFSLSLLTTLSINAQETLKKSEVESDFNKWSIDLNAGLSKPTTPFTTNYYSSNTNFIHGDLGVRYMFNNKLKIKVKAIALKVNIIELVYKV
jgi:OmpA-OmpF porin, OOP family